VLRPDFTIHSEILREDLARIAVAGELDLACAGPLRSTLRGEAQAQRDVVLDLSRVGFIDPVGLAAVVLGLRSHREVGRRMWIEGALPPAVERLATLTGTVAMLRDARPPRT
jgi:anti-anti-sigma factor